MKFGLFKSEKDTLVETLMFCDEILRKANTLSGQAKLVSLNTALNRLEMIKINPQSFGLIEELKLKFARVFHELARYHTKIDHRDAGLFYKKASQNLREVALIRRYSHQNNAADQRGSVPTRSLRIA